LLNRLLASVKERLHYLHLCTLPSKSIHIALINLFPSYRTVVLFILFFHKKYLQEVSQFLPDRYPASVVFGHTHIALFWQINMSYSVTRLYSTNKDLQ
jgi:hypothetical protein